MRLFLAIAIVLGAVQAAAQDGQGTPTPPREPRNERERLAEACSKFDAKGIVGCLADLVTDQPLHVTGGSIAPQNGMGAGLAFVSQRHVSEEWTVDTNADAVFATSRSWRAGVYVKAIFTKAEPLVVVSKPGAGAVKPLAIKARPEFNAYVQHISLRELPYYGIGPETPLAGRAFYEMGETIAGGNVIYPVFGASGLAVYGELNGRLVDVRGRSGLDSPAIDRIYTETSAPGLTEQPGVLQTGEGVRFARNVAGRAALRYAMTLQQHSALSNSSFSFQRVVVDLSHEFPLYRRQAAGGPATIETGPDESPRSMVEGGRYSRNREGSVQVRVLVTKSWVPDGHVVPFYAQPTLGGSDVNGSLALPSYADYRFRGPDLFMAHAGIEHSLWGPIGAMASVEAGRVDTTLRLNSLRVSYGAGLTIRAGGFPQVLLFFAWGGGEGTHTIGYISPSLLGGSSRPPL